MRPTNNANGTLELTANLLHLGEKAHHATRSSEYGLPIHRAA
jgi:hypothetical protein